MRLLSVFFENGFFLLLFCLLAGSAKSQTVLNYVPADADLALTFNLGNLDRKVSLNELRQYDFYQAILSETRRSSEEPGAKHSLDYFEKMMYEPASIGYDYMQPFCLFIKKTEKRTLMAVATKLSDRAKYEAGLRQFKYGEYEKWLNEKDGYRLWQKGAETFAWNDEVVLDVMTTERVRGWLDRNEEDFSTDEDDWLGEEDEELPDIIIQEPETAMDDPDGLEKDESAALAEWVDELMNMRLSQSIASNGRFMQAVSKPSDVHFWMDYSLALSFLNDFQKDEAEETGEKALALVKGFIAQLYSDTYLSTGLNFEKGKVSVHSSMFFNDDFQQFYAGMLDGKFNRKFLRYIKGGNQLFGYFYLNLNAKKTIREGKTLLYKMLDGAPEYGQLTADMVHIFDLFIDEEAFAKVLKGDLLLAVSGIQQVEVAGKTYEFDEDFNYTEKDTLVMETQPVVTLLASYDREEDLRKFISLGLHYGTLKQEGDYYRLSLASVNMEFYLALHKGALIITNNRTLIRQNRERGLPRKLRLDKTHRRLLRRNSSVLYWNLPNTMQAVASEEIDSNTASMDILNTIIKEYEGVLMTVAKKPKLPVESRMDLNFNDKKTNALRQLFEFFNNFYMESIGGAKI